MKKLIYLALICFAVSCQKTELTDDPEGRSTEEQTDSTTVTPNFEAEDWEGVIDVGFGFG